MSTSNIVVSSIVGNNSTVQSYRAAASAVVSKMLLDGSVPAPAEKRLFNMSPMEVFGTNPLLESYMVCNSGDSGLLQAVTPYQFEQLGRAIASINEFSLVRVDEDRLSKGYLVRRDSDGLLVKAMYRKGTNQALCYVELEGGFTTGKMNQRAFRVIQEERERFNNDALIAWSQYHYMGWLLANPKLYVNAIAGDMENAQFEVYYGWVLQTWKNAGLATKFFPYLSYAQSVGESLVIDQLLETIEIA